MGVTKLNGQKINDEGPDKKKYDQLKSKYEKNGDRVVMSKIAKTPERLATGYKKVMNGKNSVVITSSNGNDEFDLLVKK